MLLSDKSDGCLVFTTDKSDGCLVFKRWNIFGACDLVVMTQLLNGRQDWMFHQPISCCQLPGLVTNA